MTAVFRYKTSLILSEKLKEFAQKNKHLDRIQYKDAWDRWCNSNADLIAQEERILLDNGYKKDVKEKLFKSGKYYYSKLKNYDKKTTKSRGKYVSVGTTILSAIDDHIHKNYMHSDYTPASGYIQFCNDNIHLLRSEIAKFCENQVDSTSDIISLKLKKTYKNRYYIINKLNLKKIDNLKS